VDAAQPSPRVSVILRTKDRPELLAEALASLRAQTFADFETVLVNDGGPLPGGLLSQPPGRGLTVIAPPAPGGRTHALNAGLAAAQGGWIAYLDDDDVYLPGHLAALEGARAAGARAAHTSVRKVQQEAAEDGTFHDAQELIVYERPCDPARLLYRNDIPLIAIGHERELVEETGPFDPSFDLYEDWEFLIRLSRAAPVVHVPLVTAVYRVREGSSVTTVTAWRSPESQAARRKILEKHRALCTAGTELAFADGLEDEINAALGRERFLLGEYARTHGETEAALRALGEETERAERLESDLAEAHEGLHRSATREQALAVQNAHLTADVGKLSATLEQIYRSRVWRLFTPWWKLRERLKR
jgi:hypothetical protein